MRLRSVLIIGMILINRIESSTGLREQSLKLWESAKTYFACRERKLSYSGLARICPTSGTLTLKAGDSCEYTFLESREKVRMIYDNILDADNKYPIFCDLSHYSHNGKKSPPSWLEMGASVQVDNKTNKFKLTCTDWKGFIIATFTINNDRTRFNNLISFIKMDMSSLLRFVSLNYDKTKARLLCEELKSVKRRWENNLSKPEGNDF
jgi:hypothetical protein